MLTAALEISTFLPGAGGDNDSYFHPPQPTSSHLPQPQTEADITIFANMTSQAVNECEPCELNQERGYVIYSAVFSFYAPMLVMMFFNWRIFRTANKTTKAIRQGWTKVKGAEGADIGKRHAIPHYTEDAFKHPPCSNSVLIFPHNNIKEGKNAAAPS